MAAGSFRILRPTLGWTPPTALLLPETKGKELVPDLVVA
jgi:hypothetical protein